MVSRGAAAGGAEEGRDVKPARARMWIGVSAVAVGAAVATCGYRPPAVPVGGDRETLGFLAGEWAGSYRGADSGRTGSLFFRLAAGADTAYGDVLIDRFRPMHPSDEQEIPEGVRAPPVLTIRFVRASGDAVYGVLDEYRDPDCGCRLRTTFTGIVNRDRIEGTFVSTHVETGVEHEGSWSARRTGPPPRVAELTGAAPPADSVAVADSLAEPGLKGPTAEAMVAQGRALFRDLGCSFCHGADRRGRIGPPIADVARHRSFAWIYRMVLNPDSMVRDDPLARDMYADFGFAMPDRGANPWEALMLYEYLVAEAERETPPPR